MTSVQQAVRITESKNVEPLLFGIGATVLGLLLGYAIMVFASLQVGILAIALY